MRANMFTSMDDLDQWHRRKRCRLCGALPGKFCTYPSGRLVPRSHGIRQIEANVEVRDNDGVEYERAVNEMWRGRRRVRKGANR